MNEYVPCREIDGSSFASRYALSNVDCITIGSSVVWKLLCLPFRDVPANALFIVELGYGMLFGPRQLIGSVKASPDKYFNFPPPLHFSVE
jgi:hypothetical protein